MTTPKFLWNPVYDPRSRYFAIAKAFPQRKLRSYSWALPLAARLDQGPDGACTGFATAHDLAARPAEIPGPAWLAQALYHRARQLDNWPGEDYEGTSILAVVKAARELGVYGSFHWAFSVEDLALAVGYAGPVIVGILWYEGMMKPRPLTAEVVISGHPVGGHALLCRGFNTKTKNFLFTNSWGLDWGPRQGDCYMSWDTVRRLIELGAEMCVPTQRKNLKP